MLIVSAKIATITAPRCDADHFNRNGVCATGNALHPYMCKEPLCVVYDFFTNLLYLIQYDTYYLSYFNNDEEKDHMNWFSLDFWLHLVWHRQTQIHICIHNTDTHTQARTVFSITEITVEILIGWCNQFLFHAISYIHSFFFLFEKKWYCNRHWWNWCWKYWNAYNMIWFAIETVVITLIGEEHFIKEQQ